MEAGSKKMTRPLCVVEEILLHYFINIFYRLQYIHRLSESQPCALASRKHLSHFRFHL